MAGQLPEHRTLIVAQNQLKRLDQILANLGYGSRREVKTLINRKRVTVGETIIRDPGHKADPHAVRLDGQPLEWPDGITVIFHKPAGYVCSHDTREGPRIYDILPSRWLARNPVPTSIGRLDKDTTGIIIITDNLPLVHQMTSPKHKVEKVYEVTVDSPLQESLIASFASGQLLLQDDDTPCAPAELVITSEYTARLTLTEGRFHQVKRMFAHFNHTVTRLHRSRFGNHTLNGLSEGEWIFQSLRLNVQS